MSGFNKGGNKSFIVTLPASLGNSAPEPLGVASAGVAGVAAREDHTHVMPSLGDLGAIDLAAAEGAAAAAVSTHEGDSDPHTQYVLADGTRAMTGDFDAGSNKLTNVASATDLTDGPNYGQLISLLNGLDWQGSVFSMTTTATPGSPTTGDKYVVPSTGVSGAWVGSEEKIAVYGFPSAGWNYITPNKGTTVHIEDTGYDVLYNGNHPAGSWVNIGVSVDHAALLNNIWTDSGHTGTPLRIAAFDADGDTSYLQIGVDVQGYSSVLEEIADGIWAGASSITTLGTVVTGIWNGTAIPVAYGGTGATTQSGARSNLGLAIGTNVQAYSAVLTQVAVGTWTGASSITAVGTVGTGVWQATAVGLAYGGTGATTAAAAFANLKQVATTSDTGVVQLAGASDYTAGKVMETTDHRVMYTYPEDKCGARVPALNGTATGTGVLSGFTQITAPARNYVTGYGHIDSNTASTTLDRGWYLTPSTNSHLTMDKLTGSRLAAQMACPSDNGRYFIGFVEANTATLTPATAGTVYRFIRLGVFNNVFTWSIADGTNEVTGSLTSTGHTAGTVYEYEIIWTSSSSVTFNIYTANRSALVETHTRTTTIPSGTTQCFIGQWCRTASTTPTWHYGLARLRIP